MSAPSFSVITPSFNQAQFIRANIEAVLAQDYAHIEHIVIDNASTDGTVDILREYPSVQWVSEPDIGQSDAINKAVLRSSNDWIVWVNSDDFLLPCALTQLAKYIEQHRQCSVIYSNIFHVDNSGNLTGKVQPIYTPWKLRHWWWNSLQLWQPGTVFKRDVFKSVGAVNTELHFAMDFDFMLRAQDKYRFDYLDAELVAFRHHDEQKGHANEMPFIDERIRSTLAYWKCRTTLSYSFYRVMLYFVRGSLMFVQGLREFERGNQAHGKLLIGRGLRRNPFSIFRPEHAGFWLRKILGRKRYYRHR